MRYNCNCPRCGKPRSLSDACLWPECGAEYPEPAEPQQCLDCPAWMQVIVHDYDNEFHVIEVPKPEFDDQGRWIDGVRVFPIS